MKRSIMVTRFVILVGIAIIAASMAVISGCNARKSDTKLMSAQDFKAAMKAPKPANYPGAPGGSAPGAP